MSRTWAWAAVWWMTLFALMSLFAAVLASVGPERVPGIALAQTIGKEIERLVREGDRGFIVVLWISVVAKGLAIGPPLALARGWRAGWWRFARMATGVIGLGCLLYGLANLVDHALMVSGAKAVPAGLGIVAARWHLGLWDPVWLIGGALYLLAAWTDRRATRSHA